MSRLRKVTRARNFSIVPNDIWERADLSYRARGLLLAMTSRPEDWTFRLAYFEQRGTEGTDAIKGAYRELRGAGYVRLVRVARAGGRFGSETWVSDEPIKAWALEYSGSSDKRGPMLHTGPHGELLDPLDGDGPQPDPDPEPEVENPLPEEPPEVGFPDSGESTSLTRLMDQEETARLGDQLTTRERARGPVDKSRGRVIDLRDHDRSPARPIDPRADSRGPANPEAAELGLAAARALLGTRKHRADPRPYVPLAFEGRLPFHGPPRPPQGPSAAQDGPQRASGAR